MVPTTDSYFRVGTSFARVPPESSPRLPFTFTKFLTDSAAEW
jgi:hypothetical protein